MTPSGVPHAEEEKRLAGEAAAALVEDGMVVGLGTGSTVYYTIHALARRMKEDDMELIAIPTSKRTENLARQLAIPLSSLEEHPVIDVTIDGADEIDPDLDLIKGLGGALLREKMVATASKRLVIVADSSKAVNRLGTKSPLPVEVVPFGLGYTRKIVERLGCTAVPRPAAGGKTTEIDEKTAEGGELYTTDNGNHILDCRFPGIENPKVLERELNMIPGVVENGLFVGLASDAYIGHTGQPGGQPGRVEHRGRAKP
ncbi:MAG: ribose-5-phosphate isomerase RpiA [Thermoplasmata archaeon]|nr:ribose-5-phosphate isomerase RpiA [Thermoplasmata archaeon]